MFYDQVLVYYNMVNCCHDNNGVAIYVGRAATVHNPLF